MTAKGRAFKFGLTMSHDIREMPNQLPRGFRPDHPESGAVPLDATLTPPSAGISRPLHVSCLVGTKIDQLQGMYYRLTTIRRPQRRSTRCDYA